MSMIVGEPIYSRSKVHVENGIAAGGHRETAVASVRILQMGGNAVDGLVAGALAGMVAEPASCNLGGYGHTTVWMEKGGHLLTFDHYVTAPLRAYDDMFEIDTSVPATKYGYPWTKGQKSERGFLSPAVPGALAGFFDAHAMFGKLPWKVLLEPAIELAEKGMPFTWYDKLKIATNLNSIASVPATAKVLLPRGRPPLLPFQSSAGGDMIETPELVGTLKTIAMEGKDGFYKGRIAETIDRYIRGNGGILGADDLAAYRTRILKERPSHYRDLAYTSCFDQVAYQITNMAECFDIGRLDPNGWEHRHLMAELLGVGYTDNVAHYGDPDFEDSPVSGLTNPAFGKASAKRLSLAQALPRPIAIGDPWPYQDAAWDPERIDEAGPRQRAARTHAEDARAHMSGTSQVVCADRDGNMATTIYSIGDGFGQALYIPEVGIFLNNSMKNYDPRPNRPNSLKPGKRPIFAAPSMVMTRDGKSVFAGAGSGGYRIESGVLHAMVHALDFGMEIQDAVDHPRVHCQGQETVVDQRIPSAVRDKLEELGHELDFVREWPSTLNFGRVCAIHRNPKTGVLSAGAAPAWTTGVAGY